MSVGVEERLRVAVLSEDGEAAQAAVLALFKRLMGSMSQVVQVERLVEPVKVPPNIAKLAQMNVWQGRRQQKEFIGGVADLLRDDCVVVWMFDADTVWSQSSGGQKTKKMEKARAALRALHEQALPGDSLRGALVPEEVSDRVIVFHPTYELEAWLYQNIDGARDLLHSGHPKAAVHHALLGVWGDDPDGIEEIPDVKGRLPVKPEHYPTLAEGLSLKRVREATRSLACAREAVHGCRLVQKVMDRATPDWARAPS